MQQAVLYTPSVDRAASGGVASLAEVPVPGRVARGHALVRVAFAGVCGTDLHILAGRVPFVSGREPRVLGHEGSGYVIQLAEDEVDELAIRVGDLVVLQPTGQCGLCGMCRAGRYNQCDHVFAEHIGYNWNGTWQSVLRVPLSRIHPVRSCLGGLDGELSPDQLPADWAVLAEPLSSVVNGLNRLGHLACATRTLVNGAGIIGLLASLALRRRGVARVTVSEPSPDRRQLVAGLNAILGGLSACTPEEVRQSAGTAPGSYDLVVECSGSPEAAALACAVASNSGRVLLVGIGPADSRLTLEPLVAILKELTVLTAFANRFSLPESVAILVGDLARIDGLSLELLGVRRLPLAEYETGVRLMRECKVAKVLLQP